MSLEPNTVPECLPENTLINRRVAVFFSDDGFTTARWNGTSFDQLEYHPPAGVEIIGWLTIKDAIIHAAAKRVAYEARGKVTRRKPGRQPKASIAA